MHKTQEKFNEYWDDYAKAFIHPLLANGILNKFINNSSVIGAYTEAWVRYLIRSMFPFYRISTGSIITPSDRMIKDNNSPQCDIIIWDPSEMPALFEQGEFALVPKFSARAIIEIKKSISNMKKTEEQISRQRKCLFIEFRQNVMVIVVSHNKSLFNDDVQKNWLNNKKWKKSTPIVRLLDSISNEPDTKNIIAFISFLSQIAKDKTRPRVSG